MMSRAKPVSRDRSVKPPTVKMRPSMRRFYSMRRRCKIGEIRHDERAAHALDDPILRRLVEIGMHRQADDIVRKPLADRQAAVGDREIPVGGLLMHRLRHSRSRSECPAPSAPRRSRRGRCPAAAGWCTAPRSRCSRRQRAAPSRHCRGRAHSAPRPGCARRSRRRKSSASRSGSPPAWCRAAPVRPRRTLSYLSEPWPWTRMLRSVSASSSSSVKIAPPSP